MNRFCNTCLLLIVLLLAVIAIGPLLAPQPIHAAQRKYIAVSAAINNSQQIQTILDRYSADGWEFVAAISPDGQYPTLFFRK
jgi:uncharacterized protein (UPF0333 family)